ncbi:MAG: HAD-IC family P-type ATPase [Alphaproteobacteria bacterium]|nr:HAD-IC family P-type ATPase [Alphaproteobacteria bacterium]
MSALDTPHAASNEAVLRALDVELARGLAAAEARRRRERHGPNRLQERAGANAWTILADQAKSLVFLLLALSAGLSFAFGEVVQAVAILVALGINVAIGFVTEWRAQRSMAALRAMERTTTRVRRDGRVRRIDADGLVPGDVVLLAAGEVVPADLRLCEANGLHVDESSLTGEAVPVGKTPEAVAAETPLAERSCVAFKGTAVANGAGTGVVVATGRATELGRISALAAGAESAATPLEQRLDRLAQRLLAVILAVAAAVGAIGVVVGRDLELMIETGVALVVAAVPEGLPVVASIALARGMWRMARRNAVIERLAAVETLGAVTVIGTDKTGTLTENRMTLARLALPDGDVVLADTADPRGRARLAPADDGALPDDGAIRHALEVAAACNTATLDWEAHQPAGEGDPTELALIAGAAAAGVDRRALLEAAPERRRVAFDPATKMMATFHGTDGDLRVAVKGAPEAVAAVSTQVRAGDGAQAFDDTAREAWRERTAALARDGLRALALAEKRVAEVGAEPYRDLTFLGLVGLLDPPRAGVREAVAECRRAGIRVVMITGDQPETAVAIAREVGLVDDGEPAIMTGRELAHAERADVLATVVFARVDPGQKLDLIETFQGAGERVAMTGDGVNDAPALEAADIGVAMGRRGTQVAKEAADMVLKDDSFATIVAAIAQGRAIFANIRRFILYMLSGNAGEIFAVSAVAVLDAPLPLLPLQILYINIVSDVFPALALGVAKGGERMDRSPRDPEEAIMTRGHWLAVGGFGLVIGGAALAVFAWALLIAGMDHAEAVTLSFATFTLARLWHTFNMRDAREPLTRDPVLRNPFAWAAIALGVALLAAALYVPPIATALETVPPSAAGWTAVLLGSLAPLVVGQLALARWARSAERTARPA